jgi:hypothetical protein
VQPKVAAQPRAVLPPPAHWPAATVRPLQQKVAPSSVKAPLAAFHARTVQRASSGHPSQKENTPFKVGTHKCTGYNPYHLDTNPQPTRKGRAITKAPKEKLDRAVFAINAGQAIFVRTDGRNDYVVFEGYCYGVHSQVFDGKRQIFPDHDVSSSSPPSSASSSTHEPEKSIERKSKEDLDEDMGTQTDAPYPSREPIYVIGLTDAPIIFEGAGGKGELAFGTTVKLAPSLSSLSSTQRRIVVLSGTHHGKYGTVDPTHVTELHY